MEKKRSLTNSSVRELALNLVYEVLDNGAYTNLALDRCLREEALSMQDKRMITEIVNGTVRMVKHLDWVLNLFLKRDIEKQNPIVKNILRISIYQLMFMDGVPDYACVNEAVNLARKKTNSNMSKLVNGVLRTYLRNKGNIQYPDEQIEYFSTYYSHPQWIVRHLFKEIGEEMSTRVLEYNNRVPELVLRCNSLKLSPAELKEELNRDNITCEDSPVNPGALRVKHLETSIRESKNFNSGKYYIQNEASMLAADILNPHPGSRVYDLCAGIGGKSTHLAEKMNNNGEIFSLELYNKKIEVMKYNTRRLGIDIIHPVCADILNLDQEKFQPADYVLLDVPCSGLGVLNRRADSRWKKKPEDIEDLNRIQKSMLSGAAALVRPGGFMLYSTCTLNTRENKEVVLDFLGHYDFDLTGFADRIKYFPLDIIDKNSAQEGSLTILPGKYYTDGMFYALMRRRH